MRHKSTELKYQHIRSELVSTIQSGMYRQGDKLPSENELADSYRASRSTVIRALREVEEQGLIERRQGSGSFVTKKALQQPSTRAPVGLLKTVQSGRYPDSIVDQLQAQLASAMQRRGSALIVHSIEKTDDPIAIARDIIAQPVAGVFVVPMPPHFSEQTNQALVDVFAKAGRPIVLLDGDIVPSPQRSLFDVVGTDNLHCGYQLTTHLLSRGARRIVFLGIRPVPPTVGQRRAGYLLAMKEHGIDVPDDWLCDVDSDDVPADFVAGIIRHIRPDAIICKSDEFAALLMHRLQPLGIQVPRDLKIVGFDDRPIASLLPITLTTIRQPVTEIADGALHLMDLRIAQPHRAPSYLQFQGELVVRESSK